MLVIRAQSQLDECASVRRGFGLPIIVRLITLHGLLSLVIPHAGRLTRQVVLTDQGLLNFQGALRIDFLLSVSTSGGFSRLLALARGRVRRRTARLGTLLMGGSRSTGCRLLGRRSRLAVSLGVLGG